MMKRSPCILSIFPLILALVCMAFLATSCNKEDNDGAVTTESSETEAPYVDARPTTDLPADAASLDALILSIEGATIENEEKIDAAYLAYCALSAGEKTKVTFYETLADLRYELTKAYVVKEYMDSRIPHNEFLIGVYTSGWTEEHMKQIAECHVDFTWGSSTFLGNSLDDHLKYGLGMFAFPITAGLPHMWEGAEEDYRAKLADVTVTDHPAIWAIDCYDEPSADRFAAIDVMGQVIRKEALPEVAYFTNLLPNYASSEQYGTPSYKQYVMAYINRIESDVICYDHYFIDQCNPDRAYFAGTLENFDLVSDMCRQSGRDHYVILQVSHGDTELPDGHRHLTEEMMKLQAYTAMAYGVKAIAWATWQEGRWGFTGAPLGEDGELTDIYYSLQSTNADLKALEPTYMRYSWVSSAVHCGENSPQSEILAAYAKKNGVDQLKQTALVDLTSTDGDAVVIGHFEKNVGEGDAYLFVGCDDIYNMERETASVTFKTADSSAVVTAYVKGVAIVLDPDEKGFYTIEIAGADAVFVTVA